MMSIEDIRAFSDEAAKAAAKARKTPYVPFDEAEIESGDFLEEQRIPFIGGYEPKGWKLVEELFTDITGCGAESEPALTLRALKAKMIEYQRMEGDYGYAAIEVGPFQAYIGVFKKTRHLRAV